MRFSHQEGSTQLVDLQGSQPMCRSVFSGRLLREARFGQKAPFGVAHLDLDPSVLRIEHTSWKAVTDAFIAYDDVDRECVTGHRRSTVGRQRGCPIRGPNRCDIDTRRAAQESAHRVNLRRVAANRREPALGAGEAMRPNLAVSRRCVALRRVLQRHVAAPALLRLDSFVDARSKAAGVGRSLPSAELVLPDQVGRVARIRRQE
jgi:hypothetical protein